jgi:aerobic carbon-monoxide dehydrogenase medium subunit
VVLDDGRVGGLRAAVFGVGATPVLAREAARAAEGTPVAEAARTAANALGRDLDPPGDPTTDGATRLRLARVLLRRAVEAMAS